MRTRARRERAAIARRLALALAAACALAGADAPRARANGRMPGATELTISRTDPAHLLARATFGLVQSFDGGASWQWICEQAVQVSGEADPPIALTADGVLVLLAPAGGTLVSRDRGCTWVQAPAPLAGRRAIDLTLDPGDPSRVLVATSTVDTIDDRGVVSYENLLVLTGDDAASWSVLAALPADFAVETLEIAPSDPDRIYVSGTASASPLIGVIERSEDGGETWERTTIDLPPTSGSLFIGAIDPGDPDRLWVRVPARNDRFGVFPAGLLVSSDKGASFTMLAATETGMLGFALSPDGTRLAYGGPGDGLWVGASDGSGGFQRTADLRVRCLRWNADGLYACGTEPIDPFSVGRSGDEGASFQPVYTLGGTCPQPCADASSFQATCMTPWLPIRRAIMASAETCAVPWAKPMPAALDGGTREGGAPDPDGGRGDGDPGRGDAAALPGGGARAQDGCTCRSAGAGPPRARAAAFGLLAACCGLFALRRRASTSCICERSIRRR